ncbi:MAG: hypothetical protein HY934_00415 [Candidatus Firestonebacteria bacterium]|nr:hypothetical protein [Candidatus Firestonebacteria bacterium]
MKNIKNIIPIFLISLLFLPYIISIQAASKTLETQIVTTKDLPFKRPISDEYILILSKGFDELDVIETYTCDVYSTRDKNMVFSETWTAKNITNKEFNLPDNSKFIIKSELTEDYKDFVAYRFITIRFYSEKFSLEKPIVEFTYRKMY